MTAEPKRTGNRRALPPDALKRCPSCGTARGNVRQGWHQITRDDAVVGWTCPACPTWDEPIRREASGRFVAVVGVHEQGKRRQLKRRFDQLADARQWVEEVRQGAAESIRQGRAFVDSSRFTVAQLAEEWLAYRAAEVGTPGGLRPSSLQGYKLTLKSLLNEIGAENARELTPGQIEAAFRKLAKVGGAKRRPLSHRSLTYALTALRQCYKYGQREGWLSVNPAQLAKVPGKPKKVRQSRRWTVEELQQFRASVDAAYGDATRLAAEPWVPVAMRLALCGLRRSEVLGLDWRHVDFEAGVIEIVASRTATGTNRETALSGPKTENSRRTVAVEALHEGTKKALRALWLQQGRPVDGLVIRDAAGEPVHPDTFSWRFKALCREAEVPFPGAIHATRHTLATALKEAGVPDNQGAALLGHDVATYRRFYVLADQDAAESAALAAGEIFALKAVGS